MPPGPHALVFLHGGPMDHSGMAVRVESTGRPPPVLSFTVAAGGEVLTYRLEPHERPGQGWHAFYEGAASPA